MTTLTCKPTNEKRARATGMACNRVPITVSLHEMIAFLCYTEILAAPYLGVTCKLEQDPEPRPGDNIGSLCTFPDPFFRTKQELMYDL